MSSDQLKEAFFKALPKHRGSIRHAARAVGANENTAYRWARKAGVKGMGSPGPGPDPRKPVFARLRAEGASIKQAAAQVGVHPRTGYDWDKGVRKIGNSRLYPDGTHVRYTTDMRISRADVAVLSTLHPRFLSIAEREQIADLLRQGASLRQIGWVLGRAASTIKREIDARSTNGTYQPYTAHRQWAASRARPKPAKLAMDCPLRREVIGLLQRRYSPRQIRQTLLKRFPDDPLMHVSHETIYQALYFQARGNLRAEVKNALRTGRARRRPQRRDEAGQRRFVDEMVMISERPAEIEDRAVPGHWEGDLILGAGNKSAILTLVERHTRYVMLGHLPAGHDAVQVRDELVRLIQTLPEHLRGSLTWDQGAEMARHKQVTIATDMPVYFCDPHSPWQRGSNENTNGLLRQYFPKGTDLSVHSREDLEFVAQELNDRPRMTLDWDTPAERLRGLLIPPTPEGVARTA
ncbi:integrase [Micrococcus sp. HMSC067E09]|nr:integrase [Micrococcus sp. HMSC067E09]